MFLLKLFSSSFLSFLSSYYFCCNTQKYQSIFPVCGNLLGIEPNSDSDMPASDCWLMFEWVHRVMTVLANSFWLGIISSKHVYHSGSANWMSLRFLFPRCDPGVAVACCYGQQLSCGRRLIIWYSLNLIRSEGGTWECKLRARTEEHRQERNYEWDSGNKNANHKHQVGDSSCCLGFSLDDDNIHIIVAYLLCHFIRADPAQKHVHCAWTTRCC